MRKALHLMFVFIFSSITLFGQTILINPNQEGGFELTGGFSGNGWTVVNSSTNSWIVSSVASPFAGNNSAFISSDAGTNYSYNSNITSTSHFYRQVTIPSGQTTINLKFQCKTIGEPFFDQLLVYTAPINVLPVADIPDPSTNQINGATLVYTHPGDQGTYNEVSVNLPTSLSGTSFNLIFTWQNDNSGSNGNPVSIDNISLITTGLAPLNGIYTINNSLATSANLPSSGSNFASFTDAINYLNANGVSGPVVFNVSTNQTFIENPQVINATGTSSNKITFQKNGVGLNPVLEGINGSGATDAVLKIQGGDYITIDGIDLRNSVSNSTNNMKMEYGIQITNASSLNGSSNISIKNLTITLDKNYFRSIGLLQNISFTPSSILGTNSFNNFENITILNSYNGIYLRSSSIQFDDQNSIKKCEIGSSFNFELGSQNAGNSVSGIWLDYQKNFSISQNIIHGLVTQSASTGILIENASGLNEISNNYIKNIFCSSLTSVNNPAVGLKASFISNLTGTLRVFNNFISGIASNYNSASTINLSSIGVQLQPAGSGSTNSIFEVSYNTIVIDGSQSLNSSNACLNSLSGTNQPQVKIRNNIFANFTHNQNSNARHFCVSINSNSNIGATGSLSNFNDFYIKNLTNGHLGFGGSSTIFNDLAAWSGILNQDNNSYEVDPIFEDNNHFHIIQSLLNSKASPSSDLPYIINDLDGEPRTTPNSDIGADEFTPLLFDLQIVKIISPDSTDCFTNSEQIKIVIRNKTSNDLDFNFNNVNLLLNTTGPFNQNIFFQLNNNFFNNGSPLAPLAYDTIYIGNIDLTAYGSYNLECYLSWVSDQNNLNDSARLVIQNLSPLNISSPVDFNNYDGNNISMLFNGWKECTGITPTGNISAWQEWLGFGNPSNLNARVTLNGNSTKDWLISPKFIANQFSMLTYKAAFTQPSSASGLPGTFGADDQFLIKISTDCGATFQNIDTISPTEITNSFRQFYLPLNSYNGQSIIVAFFATDGNLIDGNCDLHIDDIDIISTQVSDLSIIQQTQPANSTCFTSNETIALTLKNTGPLAINFADFPAHLKTIISGITNATFIDTINTGILLKDSSINVTIANGLNLTQPGQYYFTSSVLLGVDGDVNATNDTLRRLINSQNPTVAFPSSSLTVCNGDSVLLQPQVNIFGNGGTNNLTFTSTDTPVDIPDSDPNGITSTIAVSGLSGFATQLVSVTIDSLIHTYDGDLVISLMAPDSSVIILSQSNGSGGDNYLSTVFTPNANDSIQFFAAPFTGNYLPQESFDSLTGPSNGNWRLIISDISGGDIGTLYKWSITFNEPNVLGSYQYIPTTNIVQSDSLNYLAFPSSAQVYTLTVTDARACSASATVTLSVNQPHPLNIGRDTIICEGTPLLLDAGSGFNSYSWNTGDTTQQISPTITNVYMVEATDTNNCSNKDTLTVIVYPNPTIELGNDTTIPFGTTILLVPGFGYQSYSWNNGSTADFIEVNLPGTFVVTVTDYNGCVSRDTVTVNMPPYIDLSLLQISEPIQKSCFSGNEEFVVTVKNTGNRIYDFTLNPVSIDALVSGPIPQNFSLQIATDLLMPDSSRNFLITSSLKLSRPGSYSINAQLIQFTPDSNSTNETAILQLISTNPEINMQVTNPVICEGDTVQLQAISNVSGLTQPVVFESGNIAMTIPDNDPSGVTSTIAVSNVPFNANQIVSVNIDSIIHPSVGDLILTLISPTGSLVNLSVNNGNGANYVGTIFNDTSQNSIITGTPPFTGDFNPQNSFADFNGTAIGNWTLLVKDISDQSIVSGTIYGWKIAFPQENTIASFDWLPNTNISNASSLTPLVYPNQSGNYYLTVTDANACSSIDSVIVNVIPSPAVTFELTLNSTCVNSGLLSLDGVSPTGGTFSGNAVIQPSSFDPAVSGSGQHIISYSITDNSGCSNTAQDTVLVYSEPVVSFVLSTNSTCVNSGLLALDGVSPIGGTFSGNAVIQPSSFDPAVSGSGQHIISYSITDNSGCSNTAQDTVVVYSEPVVSFVLSTNSTCVNSGLFALDGVSPIGGTFSGNAVIQPSSFDPAVAGAGSHVITYQINDNQGCTNIAQDTLYVGTCDAINELNEIESGLFIYPNPTFDFINLLINDSDFSIVLMDALGKELLKSSNLSQKTVINLQNVEPGIYFIRLINSNKQIITKKIIKN